MNLKIMNTDERCKGLWTRVQEDKKSTKQYVIDYVILTEEHDGILTEMAIDEDRENTPYRDDSVHKDKIYTDHNIITLKLNLEMKQKQKEVKIKINHNSMERLKKATEKCNLSNIWSEDTSIQERYTKWNKGVMQIVKQTCSAKSRKIEETKEIQNLRRKRKKLKEIMKKKEKTKNKY